MQFHLVPFSNSECSFTWSECSFTWSPKSLTASLIWSPLEFSSAVSPSQPRLGEVECNSHGDQAKLHFKILRPHTEMQFHLIPMWNQCSFNQLDSNFLWAIAGGIVKRTMNLEFLAVQICNLTYFCRMRTSTMENWWCNKFDFKKVVRDADKIKLYLTSFFNIWSHGGSVDFKAIFQSYPNSKN